MNRPMVLITNDDGINSFFLESLVNALLSDFDCYVCAPKKQQSWIGRAISRTRDVQVNENKQFNCNAWEVDGTPSDCVNIALGHLLPRLPDLVVSGMNIHANVSTPLMLSSGTLAGAIEGASWNIRSIAFSHHINTDQYFEIEQANGRIEDAELNESLKNAGDYACSFCLNYLNKPHKRLAVENVNFPVYTPKNPETELTVPCKLFLGPIFEQTETNKFQFKYPDNIQLEAGEGTDLHAIQEGRVALTHLDLSRLGARLQT